MHTSHPLPYCTVNLNVMLYLNAMYGSNDSRDRCDLSDCYVGHCSDGFDD